jgi:ATP-binding cassette subfamily C protein
MGALRVDIRPTRILWRAFKDFYGFAPLKQTVIVGLTLLQSLTAGIGLLFIIPLLQLIGLDMGATSKAGIANAANRLFEQMSIELTLFNILLSYVLIIGSIASLRSFLAVLSSEVQQSYISNLRLQLYRGLLHTRWQFIVDNKMSDFLHSLSSQVSAIGFAAHLMLTFISQIILSLIMVTLVLLLSWQMALLAAACGAVLLLLLLPLNQRIHGSGKSELAGYKGLFQMLSEQLGSLKMIKSFASEDHYAQQLGVLSDTLELQQLRLTKMNAVTQWVTTVGSVIGFSLVFFVSSNVLSISLGTIFLLLVVYSRLMPQLSGLQRTYQQLLHRVPALDDVNGLFQACGQAQEYFNPHTVCPELHHQIQIQGVSFQYNQSVSPVFQDLSFTIAKNQTLALVGPSGAGKSTLADLIAGLLAPDQGHIYCDDLLLSEDLRPAWRRRVAYVTQEVYLFHDTVRANLTWVAPRVLMDDDLWNVLKLTAADDFVAKLPKGLDTIIGDRGIRLSGGERQRIALARALLSQPQLLILDEATSALDQENEQKIQTALERLQGTLTIVIIAHRETTLRHVDKRIDLGASALSAVGPTGNFGGS